MSHLRCFFLFVAVALLTGCDPPTPRKVAGANWKPDKFRPWEFRPLPAASSIEALNKEWVASNTNMIGRIYEARLSDPARQSHFKVEYQRRSSPLGNPWWTYASYRYTDPTKGTSIISWRTLGRHKPEFLKLEATPRLYWLAPGMSFDQIEFRDGLPVLEVIGIEGVTKFCAS